MGFDQFELKRMMASAINYFPKIMALGRSNNEGNFIPLEKEIADNLKKLLETDKLILSRDQGEVCFTLPSDLAEIQVFKQKTKQTFINVLNKILSNTSTAFTNPEFLKDMSACILNICSKLLKKIAEAEIQQQISSPTTVPSKIFAKSISTGALFPPNPRLVPPSGFSPPF